MVKLLIHGKSFCQDGWNNKYLLTGVHPVCPQVTATFYFLCSPPLQYPQGKE
jgi:hypothetical protein